jgi:hypothetical protein
VRLFLTLAEGEDASSARTIFATTDRQLIEILGRAISRRLGVEAAPRLSNLDVARRRRAEEASELEDDD